jgi:hypothetical protein
MRAYLSDQFILSTPSVAIHRLLGFLKVGIMIKIPFEVHFK